MNKLIAIVCVISWSGFWTFGYLALSANIENTGQVITAIALAAVGFLTGSFAYLKLAKGDS